MMPMSADEVDTQPSMTVVTAPQAEHARGWPGLRLLKWRGLGARALATVGAVLFIYAAFAPWVVVTYPVDPSAGPGARAFSYTLASDQLIPVVPYALGRLMGHLTGVTSLPYGLFGLIWLGIVTGGLLLATLLWMRLGRGGTLLARVALLAWVVLALLGSVALLGSFAYALNNRPHDPYSVVPTIIVRPDPHVVLVPLALILTLGGVVALLMAGRRAAPAATPFFSVKRLPRASWAALPLTVGVLIWALGFFAVPWATVNCTGLHLSLNHFVDGACAGLDAGDALVYSPRLGVKAIDSSITPGSLLTVIYALAAGYGLLVLLVAWRRGLTRADVLACGCWLLAVTGMAILAARGIGPILEQAPALSAAAAGRWVVGAGVMFAFVGLALAWWGMGLLWHAAPRWRTAPSPAV